MEFWKGYNFMEKTQKIVKSKTKEVNVKFWDKKITTWKSEVEKEIRRLN